MTGFGRKCIFDHLRFASIYTYTILYGCNIVQNCWRVRSAPSTDSGRGQAFWSIPDCIISLEECWPLRHQRLQEEVGWQRMAGRLLTRPSDWTVGSRLSQPTPVSHQSCGIRAYSILVLSGKLQLLGRFGTC